MASTTTFSLFSIVFLTLSARTLAQTAPPPSPSGPINITAILSKGGQFNTFVRLLTSTQTADQINNQLNNSHDGMTVFAPTDNAFMNLPGGYMNNLSNEQQVQLMQYHVLPKYYPISDLLTVPSPVRTQASFGLYFSGEGNQVNVSSGLVETQVNTALRQESPLAVYQLDKVLLPKEFTEAKAPPPSTATEKSPPADSSNDGKAKSSASGPAPSGSGRLEMGLGLVSGLGLFCIALLS